MEQKGENMLKSVDLQKDPGMETLSFHSSAIKGKLTNSIKNGDLLKNVPFRPVCGDIVLTYRMDLGDGMFAIITTDMAESLGIKEENLFEAVMENICARTSIQEVCGFLKTLDPNIKDDDIPEDCKLYIATLSDEYPVYGASVICDDSFLKEFYRAHGPFWALPSSIHEFLFLPKSKEFDAEELRKMVVSINDSEVSENDFLSNHVFAYDGNSLYIEA